MSCNPLHRQAPEALPQGLELVKKVCFGGGVLLIRPSPLPPPRAGEGVF